MGKNQIQCARCYCTLYFTGENGLSGTTGELCSSCREEKEREKQRLQGEQDWYLYDDD